MMNTAHHAFIWENLMCLEWMTQIPSVFSCGSVVAVHSGKRTHSEGQCR